MNNIEDMTGSNRVAIKLDDNSKIIVKREIVGEQLNYLVEITSNIDYALSDLAKECGYIILLHGLNIDDGIVTLEGAVIENVKLKEEYHIVNDNEFGKFIEPYTPYPEEKTRITALTLCFDEIKEMTGDIEMIQDMIDENILSMSHQDLIKFDIIVKPHLELIHNSRVDNEEINKCVPSLRLVQKSKVKKK